MTPRPIFRRRSAHPKLGGTQGGYRGPSFVLLHPTAVQESHCCPCHSQELWREWCYRMFLFVSPGAAADESADVLPLEKTLQHLFSFSGEPWSHLNTQCLFLPASHTDSWLCWLCTLLLFRGGGGLCLCMFTPNLRRPHIKELKAFGKQKVGGCVLSSTCMCTFVHSFWVCLLSAGYEGVCVSVQLCPLVLWSGSHELMWALLSQRLNSSIIYKSECQQPRLACVCVRMCEFVCIPVSLCGLVFICALSASPQFLVEVGRSLWMTLTFVMTQNNRLRRKWNED